MINNYELEAKVRDQVKGYINRVNESKYFTKTVKIPNVRIEPMKSLNAGIFKMYPDGSSVVIFNSHYFSAHPQHMFEQTVPHEVAHYLVYVINDGIDRSGHGSAHGRMWRNMMHFLDADPLRCHDLPMPPSLKKLKKTFTYACRCSEYELTSIRHNKAKAGTRYECNKCRTELKLKGE